MPNVCCYNCQCQPFVDVAGRHSSVLTTSMLISSDPQDEELTLITGCGQDPAISS